MFIARMFGRFDFIWSFVAVRPQNRTRARDDAREEHAWRACVRARAQVRFVCFCGRCGAPEYACRNTLRARGGQRICMHNKKEKQKEEKIERRPATRRTQEMFDADVLLVCLMPTERSPMCAQRLAVFGSVPCRYERPGGDPIARVVCGGFCAASRMSSMGGDHGPRCYQHRIHAGQQQQQQQP